MIPADADSADELLLSEAFGRVEVPWVDIKKRRQRHERPTWYRALRRPVPRRDANEVWDWGCREIVREVHKEM